MTDRTDWSRERLMQELTYRDLAEQRAKDARVAWHSEPRLVALSAVFAAEAGNDPGVVRFRREVLRGKLLKPNGVWPWVERQAKKPESFQFDPEHLSSSHPASIVTPDGRRIAPSEGTPLGRLSRINQNHTIWYGWSAAEAREFLLCGITPTLGATYEIEYGSKLEWIRLRVPVTFGAREVAQMYSEARQKAWESLGTDRVRERTRRIKPETAERAVFAAKHNTGATWRAAWKVWKVEHPDDQFPDWRACQNALSRAYQQVTWHKLEWRGRAAGGVSEAEETIKKTTRGKRGTSHA